MRAILFLADPVVPGSGVSTIFEAGQSELGAAVPLMLAGLAAILALSWVIRSAFIAQKIAKKASNQVGS